MITYNEREILGKALDALKMREDPLLKGFVGFDCEASCLFKGDDVEVILAEEDRKNQEFCFCGVGKKGKIEEYFNGWIIIVNFLTKDGKFESVGCTDFYLKKLAIN